MSTIIISLILVHLVELNACKREPCIPDFCLDATIDAATGNYIFRDDKVYLLSDGFSPSSKVPTQVSTVPFMVDAAFTHRGDDYVIGRRQICKKTRGNHFESCTGIQIEGTDERLDATFLSAPDTLTVFIADRYYEARIVSKNGRVSELRMGEPMLIQTSRRFPAAWNYLDAAIVLNNGSVVLFKRDFHLISNDTRMFLFTPGSYWSCPDEYYAQIFGGKTTGDIGVIKTRNNFMKLKQLSFPTQNEKRPKDKGILIEGVEFDPDPPDVVDPGGDIEDPPDGGKSKERNIGMILGIVFGVIGFIIIIGIIVYCCRKRKKSRSKHDRSRSHSKRSVKGSHKKGPLSRSPSRDSRSSKKSRDSANSKGSQGSNVSQGKQ